MTFIPRILASASNAFLLGYRFLSTASDEIEIGSVAYILRVYLHWRSQDFRYGGTLIRL